MKIETSIIPIGFFVSLVVAVVVWVRFLIKDFRDRGPDPKVEYRTSTQISDTVPALENQIVRLSQSVLRLQHIADMQNELVNKSLEITEKLRTRALIEKTLTEVTENLKLQETRDR